MVSNGILMETILISDGFGLLFFYDWAKNNMNHI